jgi:hypothetical protein
LALLFAPCKSAHSVAFSGWLTFTLPTGYAIDARLPTAATPDRRSPLRTR